MNCVTCGKSIEHEIDKARTVFYCREKCRMKYYANKSTIKQIKRGDFDNLTIARLKELGFRVKFSKMFMMVDK